MKLIKSSTTLIAALACLGLTGAAMAQKEFEQNRDSFSQPGVPQGVMHHYVYTSKAGMFPGTVRDVWVYIPAKYDAAKPAALMVFQDGGGYVGRDGGYGLPNIVDNLIAKGEMPVTVCIMANP
jgi:enterochelin esterase family protein